MEVYPAITNDLPPADLSRAGCGYRLDGLPRHGQCPECSAWFDRSDIILLGHLAGPRGEFWWSRPIGAFALFMAVIVGASIWVSQFGLVMPNPLAIWLLVAMLLLPPAIKRFRRSTSLHGYECVVRMTAKGVGTSRVPCKAAEIHLSPWQHVTKLRLTSKRKNRLTIWIRCDDLDLVDSIVDCPHELLPVLQERIRKWGRL